VIAAIPPYTASPMTTATATALARVQVEEILPATPTLPTRVRVTVPGTSYRLDLVLDGDAASMAHRVGKRASGVIRGRALRAWQATAGGCFIEPVWGTPRIVQGRILAIDVQANAALLDLAVPAWIAIEPSQAVGQWQTGDMLNFYVESGASFTPTA